MSSGSASLVFLAVIGLALFRRLPTTKADPAVEEKAKAIVLDDDDDQAIIDLLKEYIAKKEAALRQGVAPPGAGSEPGYTEKRSGRGGLDLLKGFGLGKRAKAGRMDPLNGVGFGKRGSISAQIRSSEQGQENAVRRMDPLRGFGFG